MMSRSTRKNFNIFLVGTTLVSGWLSAQDYVYLRSSTEAESDLESSMKGVSLNTRDYYAPLTQDEKSDIGYIVKTLANESLIKIKNKESTIKKVGERVEHLHPFQFLYCIFSDEEMKVGIRNIQGRSWVGRGFIEGITSSLKKEHAVGNVLMYAEEFAQSLNVDVNIIKPYLEAAKWDKFVDALIKNVPRYGDTGRYDM